VVRGVTIAPITLHTGVSSLEGDEEPYPEPYDIPPATARLVDATRRAGGRVVAVGTTVVRALETAAAARGQAGPPPPAAPGRAPPPGHAAGSPEGGGCAVHRTARASLHPSFDAERIRRGRPAPPVLRRRGATLLPLARVRRRAPAAALTPSATRPGRAGPA